MKSCLLAMTSKVIARRPAYLGPGIEVDKPRRPEALSAREDKSGRVMLTGTCRDERHRIPDCSAARAQRIRQGVLHTEMTGHIRAALEAGADEYVMKPFDRETLHIKLQLVGVA